MGHEGLLGGAAEHLPLGVAEEALGLVESIDVAADLVRIEETVRPDAAAIGVYAALRPVFAELYEALVPTYRSLRRLSPQLPLD